MNKKLQAFGLIFVLLFSSTQSQAFVWKKIKRNIKKEVNKEVNKHRNKKANSGIGQKEAALGLKEALTKGAHSASTQLSKKDGYFRNQAIKILFPPEFRKAEKTLRKIGMGKMVDKAVLSMNRAAETAADKSYPIFRDAIVSMTFTDAMKILFGSSNSATNYLRNRTGTKLHTAFLPIVRQCANEVAATRYWDDVAKTYNRVPFIKRKVPEDISNYITQNAIHGVFYRVEEEERLIRANPISRTTSLLRRVFGYADSKKGK